ncbi:MAG: leucine-rich repeat domain-containing protein, partial [Clostridia bacterium]|nr:leucine-rich repeat domain-containing protein [Clostridia bacterium]
MYNKNFRKAIGMLLTFAMIISFLPVSAYGIATTDTAPPTLMSASRTSNTAITVTLSENCQNLTKTGDGGFTVTQTGGTATYAVTATAQGADLKHAVLTVADLPESCDSGVTVTYTKGINGTIADTAGNALETGSTGVAVPAWDGTPPTLMSASLTSSTQITVALSEDCQNLTQANDGGFTVKEMNGTAAYTVSATAQGDDTDHVVLTVADVSASASKGVTVTYTKGTNGTIADLAGNALETNTSGVSIAPWDSDVPTVEITTTADDPTYTSPIPVTITFSESVTGFTEEDITVGNATKSNFSGSGSVYTIRLRPVANGTVTVNVAADAAVDSANNGNAAAEQFSIVYASTVDYAVDGGYITFAPSTGTVTGFKGSPAAVVIPNEINGVAVTMLGQNSFSDCTSMTSVVIPDSVTVMCQSVFYGCTGLTSINIPDGVTVISQVTFYGCTGLTDVTLPDGLKSIKESAFEGCTGLAGITLPDALETIEWGAFSSCTGLTAATVPQKVTSLGNYAFENCGSLSAVYMKGDAPTYGTDVFLSTAAGITVYYKGGATGFSGTYAGCPTALWGQHTVTVSCGAGGTVSPENPSVYVGETATFTITPGAGFQLSTLTFNGALVTADAEGKYTTPAIWAAASFAVTFETGGTPSAVITTAAEDPTNTSPIPVTITFSEAVTGFELNDIGVTGGTAGNFSATSAAVYIADITPSGDGTVTISVAAGAAQNGGGVGSRASTPLSVVYDSTAPSLSNAQADEITNSAASLNFRSSEAGTYYYLVYPAADTAPDADTVKAQGDGTIAKGMGAAASGTNSAAVTGLSVTTDYKAYVVVEDAAGNLSAVKTIAFSTTIVKIPLTSAVTSFESGKTYTIKDVEQYKRMAGLTQGRNPGTGATFELLCDITFGYWQDLNGDGVVGDGEIFDAPSGGEAYTAINYRTIGSGGYFFSGTFDGCGHTISGLYCKKDASGESNYAVFATVDGGTVKNLRIANSYIKSDGDTAGIAGELINGSTVEYCVVDSSVTIAGRLSIGGIVGACKASTIQYCYNMGCVSGTGANVGGIVGNVENNGSLIQYCCNIGNVSGSRSGSGSWSEVGGIAGRLTNYTGTTSNILRNCCNTGSISALTTRVGGIVGSSRDMVENCYNAGAVTGSSSVGGIAGEMHAAYGGVTTGCYYDKSICTVGGINGADAPGSAEGKTTAQMTSGTAFSEWDTAAWTFPAGSYPELTAFISTDESAPSMEDAQMLSRTSVKVTLSEDCRLLTKANNGGFTVKETGGTAVYAVTATAQGDNSREVVLTVEDMFASGGKGVTVTYVHGTNGTIEDLAGNTLGSDASGVAAAAWETTPPTMVSAKYVSDTQITVKLSEECFNLTNINDGGFTVKEKDGTAAYAVTSTVEGSNKEITLYVENMSASCAKGVTVTYTKGGGGIVTDLMGNAMQTDGKGVPVAAWDTGKPEVDGVANGEAYNTDVTATFAEGTATLAKDSGAASAYASGTEISAEGGYVLTVTNAVGSTVISFTIDKTAPVLSGVSLISVTSAGAELQFTSSEETPWYCLILPAEDSAPDEDAVRAIGPGAGRVGGASAGSNTVDVGGVIAETDYTAYLILEDSAGNRSDIKTVGLATKDTVIPLDDSVTTLQSGVTYTINSADQLNRLGYLVQNGKSGEDSTFVLTEDIVFGYWQDKDSDGVVDDGEICNAESGGTAYTAVNYTVIGKKLFGFAGTFDGRGHTVSGLYTSEENTVANLALSALFGYVNGGIVRNVGVKNSYIRGYKNPGGVVGVLESGTVENCRTDESVTVVGNGGVVGSMDSSVIKYCQNAGTVINEGMTTQVGGIVGEVCGTGSMVLFCYNTGAIYTQNNRHGTGGIAGVIKRGSGNCL